MQTNTCEIWIGDILNCFQNFYKLLLKSLHTAKIKALRIKILRLIVYIFPKEKQQDITKNWGL
jgi:hypothetical protein